MNNRKKWRRWVKAIDRSIFLPVRIFTPIFKGYVGLLESNPKIRNPFHFHEWVLHNHSNNLLLTIRKIADKDKRAHSVRGLLGSIYCFNTSLTKKSYLFGCDKRFYDNYLDYWRSICGNSSVVPKNVVDTDIKELDKLTNKAYLAVNQTIAHIAKNRRIRKFEYDSVYDTLKQLLQIFHKYSLLLRVQVDDSLEAVIPFEWQKIFYTPWRPN